jgi:AcrR family transcriptional regulator
VDAILEATARTLVDEGYAAATTTHVAEVAGVSIGTLYQYYPSREALVAALVDRHIGRILEVLAEATENNREVSLAAATRQLLQVLLRMHAAEPRLHVVLSRHFDETDGFDRLCGLSRGLRALVEASLQERRAELRPTDLRLASLVLVHAVHGVISAVILEGGMGLDSEALLDELTELVMGYLGRRA